MIRLTCPPFTDSDNCLNISWCALAQDQSPEAFKSDVQKRSSDSLAFNLSKPVTSSSHCAFVSKRRCQQRYTLNVNKRGAQEIGCVSRLSRCDTTSVTRLRARPRPIACNAPTSMRVHASHTRTQRARFISVWSSTR